MKKKVFFKVPLLMELIFKWEETDPQNKKVKYIVR